MNRSELAVKLELQSILGKISRLMKDFPSDGLRVLAAWIKANQRGERLNEQEFLDKLHQKMKRGKGNGRMVYARARKK